MPAKPRSNSEKLDQVCKEAKKHTKEIAGLKQEVSGLKQQFEDFKATMMRLYDHQERKAEEDREENRKFREAMYSLADRVVKAHENFTIEKLALGAKQDRLETEVEALQESDEKQNKAIAKLDTRVAYLEAKAP